MINKNKANYLFYILMSTGAIASLLGLIFIGTNGLTSLLLAGGGDIFMDFRSCAAWASSGEPYAYSSSYPPLALMFHYFFSLFGVNDPLLEGNMIAVYCTVTAVLLAFAMFFIKKGRYRERGVFVALMLFSAPFMFERTRANIITIAVVFLAFYLIGKDSNDKLVREFALISLAISAGVKIYPAVFGMLLIKEKRYKEAIRTVIYGIAAFILPFFMFGGVSVITKMITQLLGFVSSVSSSAQFGFSVGSISTIKLLSMLMNCSVQSAQLIANTVTGVLTVWLVLNLIFSKYSKWKFVTALTVAICLLPGVSYEYVLCFMMLPIAMFLDRDEHRRIDYLYSVLFTGCMILILFGPQNLFPQFNSWPMSINVLVNAISLFLLFVLVNVELSKDTFFTLKSIWGKIKPRYLKPLICCLLVVVIATYSFVKIKLNKIEYEKEVYTPASQLIEAAGYDYEDVYFLVYNTPAL
ncbi:MAG: glycosyltransferase family 87 protein, partial [Oscillospiraceae bacterium]